jgi:hypothetical protein
MEFLFPCFFCCLALCFILAEHHGTRSDPVYFDGGKVPKGSPLLFPPEVIDTINSDITPE